MVGTKHLFICAQYLQLNNILWNDYYGALQTTMNKLYMIKTSNISHTIFVYKFSYYISYYSEKVACRH